MDKMIILITGANGFVGNKLMKTMRDAVPSPSLRGASEDDIKRIVEESNANVIIHTAAVSDMGACEADPEGSYHANVLIPKYLAKACNGRKLIAFSSDQIYNGCSDDGPYTEDMEKPANVYATQKLEMEKRVLDIEPSAVMLRAEWMYDMESYKGNYIRNLLAAEGPVSYSSKNYRGITYLKEVAENMEKVIALPGGVYNFGSETTLSMYEITKQVIGVLGKDVELKDIAPGHNLWMNCGKAAKYEVRFSDALNGVIRCIKDNGLGKS